MPSQRCACGTSGHRESAATLSFSTIFTCLIILIGYSALPSYAHRSYDILTPFVVESQPPVCPVETYSVVFDAGSTGSRVFVFQFQSGDEGNEKGSVIKLNKEFFLTTEPGISSFAKNISEASVRLKPLLQHAVKNVPKMYHTSTMLLFKATAGLRLLPNEIGEKILDEVRYLMKRSPFHIPDLNKIGVMGGDEEGLFGWVTANFLLGTLWNTTEETVIALDLGGGSVQITSALPSTTNFKSVCSHGFGAVYQMHLLKSEFTVLTHSALGHGLKSAYLYIMGGQEEIEQNDKESQEHDRIERPSRLVSPCFAPSFKSTWQHGRYTYDIVGEEPKVSRLRDCQKSVDEFVKSFGLSQYFNPKRRDVHLFSYFFDVAQWADIIPGSVSSMVLTPSDYYEAAKSHCQDNFSEDKPFLCMSLLYIHLLLTKGFGLPEDKPVHVGNQIDGRQLSWTLGMALATLSDQVHYSSLCDAS